MGRNRKRWSFKKIVLCKDKAGVETGRDGMGVERDALRMKLENLLEKNMNGYDENCKSGKPVIKKF